MMDLNKLVSEARNNLEELNKIRKELSQLESSVISGIRRLSFLIKEGDTTGDSILDLAILRHGSLDDELIGKYRTLENRLKGKVGQNIWVITEEDYCYVYGAVSNPEHFGLQKMLSVGELTGESFIFSNDEYFFPVEGYFGYKKDNSFFLDSWMELVNYHKSESFFGNEPMEPIVLIGNEEINAWFSESKDEETVAAISEVIENLASNDIFNGGEMKKQKKEPSKKTFITVKRIEK